MKQVKFHSETELPISVLTLEEHEVLNSIFSPNTHAAVLKIGCHFFIMNTLGCFITLSLSLARSLACLPYFTFFIFDLCGLINGKKNRFVVYCHAKMSSFLSAWTTQIKTKVLKTASIIRVSHVLELIFVSTISCIAALLAFIGNDQNAKKWHEIPDNR